MAFRRSDPELDLYTLRWKIQFHGCYWFILKKNWLIIIIFSSMSTRSVITVRDRFDWSLATRLSKRTEIKFTPFADPTQAATLAMAQLSL